MNAVTVNRAAWMGIVIFLVVGTVGGQPFNDAPADSNSTAGNGASSQAGKAAKKPELTPEQKAFEQSVKALRAGLSRMNEKYVKAEQKRENKAEAEEEAESIPSASSQSSSGSAASKQGNKGIPDESAPNAKSK